MLIDNHRHMECLFNLRNRTIYIHKQAVRRRVGYRKSIGFGEIDHGLVILLRGAEAFRELSYRKKLMVIRGGGVVEPTQQVCQFGLVAERQHDGEVQAFSLWKSSQRHRLPASNCRADVIMQHLWWLLSLCCGCEYEEHGCADQ